MSREKLPPPDEDEFCIADLIASRRSHRTRRDRSRENVLNFGAGDIPKSSRRRATFLAPSHEEVAPRIDFANARIVVRRTRRNNTSADPAAWRGGFRRRRRRLGRFDPVVPSYLCSTLAIGVWYGRPSAAALA